MQHASRADLAKNFLGKRLAHDRVMATVLVGWIIGVVAFRG